MQVNMWIALWMHVTLRAIDAGRNLDFAHIIGGQKIAGIPGLDSGVSSATQ
jgi:hypothetical protein